MEALTTLVELTGEAGHAARLRSVLDLLLTRGIDTRHRHAIDEPLDRHWRRVTRWRWAVDVSYGHGAELAWLCRRAVDVLGDPPDRIRARVLGLVDHALDFGFDHRRGGLARSGPPMGHARLAWYLPAAYRTKRWWEQAEMLVATLVAHRWTGEPRYLAAFARQFAWVWTHQIDHAGGDWFEATSWRDGRPLSFVKGDEWKEPYHGARALMEVSRALSSILTGSGPTGGRG
jgi:cellobiose epimerase